MKAKKKTKKKTKKKQSPDLILDGKPSADIRKYLKRVVKNRPEPIWGRKQSGQWDHLIAALDRGHELPLEHKIAGSVATRGKRLGYVVRLSKIDDELTMLWFGGFAGVPKEIKKGKGK